MGQHARFTKEKDPTISHSALLRRVTKSTWGSSLATWGRMTRTQLRSLTVQSSSGEQVLSGN